MDNAQNARAMRIPQAAIFLGLTSKALRRAVQRGQVPYRRWGGRIIFIEAELKCFLYDLPGLRSEEVFGGKTEKETPQR